jgi:hypothetical protein
MTHADKAAELVLGNRNADYGTPHDDFVGVALIWSGILSAKLTANITAEEVALCMAGLKLRREAHKPKEDNLVDAHGYLLCLEWIRTGRQPRPAAASAWETVEDVACGTRIDCPQCGKLQPCLCGNGGAA